MCLPYCLQSSQGEIFYKLENSTKSIVSYFLLNCSHSKTMNFNVSAALRRVDLATVEPLRVELCLHSFVLFFVCVEDLSYSRKIRFESNFP